MLRNVAGRILRIGSQSSPVTSAVQRRLYHERVVDHYNNPRNVGSFDKNDPTVGTGLVGAPACGDVMKLQIKVDEETGKITDACFKTFGCGSAIASSSVATEWVKGKQMVEVLSIKNTFFTWNNEDVEYHNNNYYASAPNNVGVIFLNSWRLYKLLVFMFLSFICRVILKTEEGLRIGKVLLKLSSLKDLGHSSRRRGGLRGLCIVCFSNLYDNLAYVNEHLNLETCLFLIEGGRSSSSFREEIVLYYREIAKHLSLPPVKLHCSMLAEDAIKAAVKDYAAKRAKLSDNANDSQMGKAADA
ncbi:PREDICTED: iron-sulfur cluster assembly protein 1-like [Nicotiana attenuata]|uniref:iron-sulfur cluster assembly protein 1-like n=1 Tax=Nicotiana attenuata TaxID=49451 RepID=UPI000904963F|nr:PREDICTED: iron-sulfur cluster assembly protein 1-like [Nicotiana attenuata]